MSLQAFTRSDISEPVGVPYLSLDVGIPPAVTSQPRRMIVRTKCRRGECFYKSLCVPAGEKSIVGIPKLKH